MRQKALRAVLSGFLISVIILSTGCGNASRNGSQHVGRYDPHTDQTHRYDDWWAINSVNDITFFE